MILCLFSWNVFSSTYFPFNVYNLYYMVTVEIAISKRVNVAQSIHGICSVIIMRVTITIFELIVLLQVLISIQ